LRRATGQGTCRHHPQVEPGEDPGENHPFIPAGRGPLDKLRKKNKREINLGGGEKGIIPREACNHRIERKRSAPGKRGRKQASKKMITRKLPKKRAGRLTITSEVREKKGKKQAAMWKNPRGGGCFLCGGGGGWWTMI